MLCELIHVAFGKSEWELQAKTANGYIHWSGPPFLTRGKARGGLQVWRDYGFFTDVQAVNVRTGERLP